MKYHDYVAKLFALSDNQYFAARNVGFIQEELINATYDWYQLNRSEIVSDRTNKSKPRQQWYMTDIIGLEDIPLDVSYTKALKIIQAHIIAEGTDLRYIQIVNKRKEARRIESEARRSRRQATQQPVAAPTVHGTESANVLPSELTTPTLQPLPAPTIDVAAPTKAATVKFELPTDYKTAEDYVTQLEAIMLGATP